MAITISLSGLLIYTSFKYLNPSISDHPITQGLGGMFFILLLSRMIGLIEDKNDIVSVFFKYNFYSSGLYYAWIITIIFALLNNEGFNTEIPFYALKFIPTVIFVFARPFKRLIRIEEKIESLNQKIGSPNPLQPSENEKELNLLDAFVGYFLLLMVFLTFISF